MPHPSAQRLADVLLMSLRHIHKGRRTRPAVEKFVTTAKGKIYLHLVQPYIQDAGAVAQVSQHQSAGFVHTLGNALHVEHVTGSIIDMTEHKQSRVIAYFFGDVVSVHGFQ